VVRLPGAFRGAPRRAQRPRKRRRGVPIPPEGGEAPPGDARDTYDLIIVRLKAFAPDGEITERAMQGVLDSIVALGDLAAPTPPVSKYVDNRYIQAAGR